MEISSFNGSKSNFYSTADWESFNKFKMSRGMLDNLKHNRSITLNTLNDLCNMLDCDITDIIEYKGD